MDELEALGDCLEARLVWVLPGSILEQMLGILVRGLIRDRVQVHIRPSILSSMVVDCLEDVSANLTHLFKRR